VCYLLVQTGLLVLNALESKAILRGGNNITHILTKNKGIQREKEYIYIYIGTRDPYKLIRYGNPVYSSWYDDDTGAPGAIAPYVVPVSSMKAL